MLSGTPTISPDVANAIPCDGVSNSGQLISSDAALPFLSIPNTTGTTATLVTLGIAVTATATYGAYKLIKWGVKVYEEYVEDEFLKELEPLIDLYETYIKPAKAGNKPIFLPPIVRVEKKDGKNIVFATVFTNEMIELKGTSIPREGPRALDVYHDSIRDVIMDLKKFLEELDFKKADADVNRLIRSKNGITIVLVIYLLEIFDSHVQNFKGYDVDIAIIDVLNTIMAKYVKFTVSRRYSFLNPAYQNAEIAKIYLEHHKEVRSLQEITRGSQLDCQEVNERLTKFIVTLTNDINHKSKIDKASKKLLASGIIDESHIVASNWDGRYVKKSSEIEILETPFKHISIKLSSFSIAVIRHDARFTRENIFDIHDEYELARLSDAREIENYKIYLEKKDDKLFYTLINIDGKKENNKVIETIKPPEEFTLKNLNLIKTEIRKYTTKAGHTFPRGLPDIHRLEQLEKTKKLNVQEKIEKRVLEKNLERYEEMAEKCRNIATKVAAKDNDKVFVVVKDRQLLVSRMGFIMHLVELAFLVAWCQYYASKLGEAIEALGDIYITSKKNEAAFETNKEAFAKIIDAVKQLFTDLDNIKFSNSNHMPDPDSPDLDMFNTLKLILQEIKDTATITQNTIAKYYDERKNLANRREILAKQCLQDDTEVVQTAMKLEVKVSFSQDSSLADDDSDNEDTDHIDLSRDYTGNGNGKMFSQKKDGRTFRRRGSLSRDNGHANVIKSTSSGKLIPNGEQSPSEITSSSRKPRRSISLEKIISSTININRHSKSDRSTRSNSFSGSGETSSIFETTSDKNPHSNGNDDTSKKSTTTSSDEKNPHLIDNDSITLNLNPDITKQLQGNFQNLSQTTKFLEKRLEYYRQFIIASIVLDKIQQRIMDYIQDIDQNKLAENEKKLCIKLYESFDIERNRIQIMINKTSIETTDGRHEKIIKIVLLFYTITDLGLQFIETLDSSHLDSIKKSIENNHNIEVIDRHESKHCEYHNAFFNNNHYLKINTKTRDGMDEIKNACDELIKVFSVSIQKKVQLTTL